MPHYARGLCEVGGILKSLFIVLMALEDELWCVEVAPRSWR